MMRTIGIDGYLRRFFLWSVGVLLAVAAINLAVDPYDRFGFNRLGVFITASREVKVVEVGRFPHDALLLGNSRLASIPASRIHGGLFYNAAFEGARLREIQWFLERRLSDERLLVLNLDPYMLTRSAANPKTDAFSPLTIPVLGNYVASLKSVEYSFRTLTGAILGKPSNFEPDGTGRVHFEDRPDPGWARQRLAEHQQVLASFQYDSAQTEYLNNIASIARKHGCQLRVYLSPIHHDLLGSLETGAAGTEWQKAVSAAKGVFPDLVNLTDSEYSIPTNFYLTDPQHFHPDAGIRFLNERVLSSGK
jgi:hypothetical protein